MGRASSTCEIMFGGEFVVVFLFVCFFFLIFPCLSGGVVMIIIQEYSNC